MTKRKQPAPKAPAEEPPDSPLLLEIEARYILARDHASKWREQAKEEFDFYAGEQWTDEDMAKLRDQQRPVVTFNRIMRLVNAVIGHENNNRAEVRYIPRTMGDAKVNELLTAASQYFRDECDAEHEESDAFRDMIISGMGWAHDRLTDQNNPEYDLIEERVDPMEMLWDPASKKPNLADSRYLFRRKRYTEKEIKAIWPDFEGPFSGGFADEDEDDATDVADRSPRAAYKGDGDGRDTRRDVMVVEYQYREQQAFYQVVPPAAAPSDDPMMPPPQPERPFEVDADKMDDKLKARLEDIGAQMVLKRRTMVRRIFVIGREIVQGPDVVCPHDFTYHCITGFRDRKRNHWFGIVRMLKDPQRWSNKWLAQIMHILNSNAKGGVALEESAVPATSSKDGFESSWADPAAVTWFADGALQRGAMQPKPPPLYPQGVDRLLQYANQSFTDVSGVNQELLGLADREQPGVLEWQRKQSAVTLLAPLFDSLRRFRKMQGRVWLYMMQKYVSDGRIVRITQDAPPPQPGAPQPAPGMGHNGGPPMVQQQINVPFGGPKESQHPQWQLPETAEYDVIVDQASSAPNQKEQTWSVLQQLLPAIKDMVPPPVMMLALEYSPLPESFVQKLKQLMAEQQQKGPPPDPEMMKVQAQIEGKKAELQMRQQEMQMTMQMKEREHALDLQFKQREAEMKLAIKAKELEQKQREAELDAWITATQAQQKMALGAQEFQFKTAQQSRQASFDEQKQERQMTLDDEAAQRQATRDDQIAAARVAKLDTPRN